MTVMNSPSDQVASTPPMNERPSFPDFLVVVPPASPKIDPSREIAKNPEAHPKHYNTGKYEVIDVIEDWKLGFNLGNVVKYLARADHKGSPTADLYKCLFYLNREIAHRERTS